MTDRLTDPVGLLWFAIFLLFVAGYWMDRDRRAAHARHRELVDRLDALARPPAPDDSHPFAPED